MGQIVHPDNYEYDGPWLLGRNALTELEVVLLTINKSLEKSFENEIIEAVKSTKEGMLDEELKSIILKIKNQYPNNKRINTAYFKSKDNIKLEGKTLNDILKDKKINSFSL